MAKIIVQKYGGSSLADLTAIKTVANLIAERKKTGEKICVVVSAMGHTTDTLLDLAKQITATPNVRELDMLVSIGERSCMALLAIALSHIGVDSVSFTGSQSGIITDDNHGNAQIIGVRPFRVIEALEQNKVAIVAGFQGVSLKKEITTLGRGGSDASAIALASALNASQCELYSDVAGVYNADPRIVKNAELLNEISFQQMRLMAECGSQIINKQAVALAHCNEVALVSRQTGNSHPGTWIKNLTHPTHLFTFAHQKLVLNIELSSEIAIEILEQIYQSGIYPFLSFSVAADKTCLVFFEEYEHILAKILEHNHLEKNLKKDLASISVTNTSMRFSALHLKQIFATLKENNIENVHAMHSPMGMHLLLCRSQLEIALKCVQNALM